MDKVLLIFSIFFIFQGARTDSPKSPKFSLPKLNGLPNFIPNFNDGNSPISAAVEAATKGIQNIVLSTNSVLDGIQHGLETNNKFSDLFGGFVKNTDTVITEPLGELFKQFGVPKEIVDTVVKAKADFIAYVQDVANDLVSALEDLLQQSIQSLRSVITPAGHLTDITKDLVEMVTKAPLDFNTLKCTQQMLPKLLESATPSGTYLSNCAVFHAGEIQKTLDISKIVFGFLMNMHTNDVVTNFNQCNQNGTETTASCANNVKQDFDDAAQQVNKSSEYMKSSIPFQLNNDLANLQNCYNSVLSMIVGAGEQLKTQFTNCINE